MSEDMAVILIVWAIVVIPQVIDYFVWRSAENAKLRELVAEMAKALRVGSEWCDRECSVVFDCDGMDECPIAKELHELGIEVDA